MKCWSESDFHFLYVISPNVFYWTTSICCDLIYKYYGKACKIQPNRTAHHPNADWLRYLALALFNTIVPPFLTVKIMFWDSTETCENANEEGWLLVLGRVLVWVFIQDVLYYFFHRLFHSIPWLYTHIHKVHHEVTVPWGWSAEVQHPIDALVTNIGTFAIAAELAGLDVTWRSVAICYMYTSPGRSVR